MLLDNKVALVYGAGGRIGGAVARAFAAEGAAVFLAGRTRARLDRVADDIRAAGGTAETARVDALDEESVDAFVDAVAEQTGRVDISFNLISYGDVQEPLATIAAEDFGRPVGNAVRTHFLTTRAAARHMVKRSSGVILAFGGSGPEAVPGLGGFVVALDAVEGLRRQWACELGPHGIRFVTLKSGGVPESLPPDFPGRAEIVAGIEQATLLRRAATLADVGDVAAFVASDRAGSMTAATVNVSCGALLD
ncbi:SDR family oxidoreductase [Streptomyces sp. SCA3-4]|uniref:SDR family NAD(P)-dependent oxidoreductase n=1 Tax=Streptomyces sichuanensis TaxID=2871810 RepID=UPI001CE2DFF1|nr:SDR family oxidoreductase [Streptomyces sichuanensis]MCA6095963.1 SDR family oxidoreductase [Streptomyces sichuanensis]